MTDQIPKMGSEVILRKLAVAPGAKVQSATWDDYIPGVPNQASLPVAYELTGILCEDIEVGQPFSIERHTRNGVAIRRNFESTEVKSIEGDRVTTQNSVYLIRSLTGN